MKCPCCNEVMTKKERPFSVTIGNTCESTNIITYECQNCGYSVDDKNNKKKIDQLISTTNYANAISILENFKQQGTNFSELERQLNLPLRTFSKWYNKSVKPSASAVILLKILNAFPWMPRAAELDYNSDEAKAYVRKYYYTEFNNFEKQITYEETPTHHIYKAIIEKKEYTINEQEPVYIKTNIGLNKTGYSYDN